MKKRILSMILTLAMVLSLFSGMTLTASAEDDNPSQVFSLYTGALTEGDYLIVYENGAMNTTIDKNRLQYDTVAPSDDSIVTNNSAIIWHIAPSGEYWTIYNAEVEKYAAGNGTKNQAQLLSDGNDDKSLWTVSGTDTYEFVNKNNAAAGVNSNLRKNGTYGFACYATGTGGPLTLYKLEAATHEHEWASDLDNPDIPATCTATGEKHLKCSVCGITKTEITPKVAHTDEDDNGICDVCSGVLYSLTTELNNQDSLVIVHAPTSRAMTATAAGNRLESTAVNAQEGAVAIPSDSAAAILKVEFLENSETDFYLKSGAKYLTTGQTGNSLTLEDTATDYSVWFVEVLDADEKTVAVKNRNASYTPSSGETHEIALEYYNDKITTYSFYENDDKYVFQLYTKPYVPAGEITVYVADETNSESFFAYICNIGGTNDGTAFPGHPLTCLGKDKNNSNYYMFTMPAAGFANVIFNNGDGAQNSDPNALDISDVTDDVIAVYNNSSWVASIGSDIWPAPGVYTPPTCTQDGYTTYTGVLGTILTEPGEASSGHSYGNWNYYGNGTHRRICSVCGYYEQGNCEFVDGVCTICGGHEPATAGTQTFVLVDNLNDLAVDDEIVFAYVGESGFLDAKAAGTLNSGNYLNPVDATIETNADNVVVLVSENAVVFTVKEGTGDGKFAFLYDERYLTASTGSSGNNNVYLSERAISENTDWTIAFDDGSADVSYCASTAENGRYLRYNATSGQQRFSAYVGLTQKPIAIFKKADVAVPVGTDYLVHFSVPAGVQEVADMTSNTLTGIDLPSAGAPEGYTFLGWSAVEVDNVSAIPAYLPAGEHFTANEETTFYALYKYGEAGDAAYNLVTDASSLAADDVVIITANGSKDASLSTTQNSNNRAATGGTKSEDYSTFTPADDTAILTLKAGTVDCTFAFYDPANNGYLYAASSGSNYLRTEEELDDNGSWKIVISDDGATITAQGSNTRNLLRYNSSSNLFSCYSSGQQSVFIYKQTGSAGSVTYTTVISSDTFAFVDVERTDYFFEPVKWALEKGITAGTDEAHFSPDLNCTRGQVMTFLWRYAGGQEPTVTENPFKDVTKETAYYYKPVLWAYGNEITNGVTKTLFGPGRACTRAQVLTFLWRYADEPEPTSTENPFTDVSADAYYYSAVLWAHENGITAGMRDNLFGPNEICTRAQVVTFLYAYNNSLTPAEP